MKRFATLSKIIIILLIVATGIFAIWYYQSQDTDGVTTGSNQTQSSGTQQPSPTSPQTSETPISYPVLVYFSKHPESDNDPGATFPLQRASETLSVATFSMSELLKGPTSSEVTQGYFTTAKLRDGTSNCGGKDFTLEISNGVATLRFCKPFDHIGSVSDGQAESAIKATLRQFGSVQKVVILNAQGDCEFDLSGLNLCKQ